jgi:hypothetical protein
MSKLNREGLNLLLSHFSKLALARVFGVSPTTLRSYCKGGEPLSQAATEHINSEIEKMLAKPKRAAKHRHPEWRDPTAK